MYFLSDYGVIFHRVCLRTHNLTLQSSEYKVAKETRLPPIAEYCFMCTKIDATDAVTVHGCLV